MHPLRAPLADTSPENAFSEKSPVGYRETRALLGVVDPSLGTQVTGNRLPYGDYPASPALSMRAHPGCLVCGGRPEVSSEPPAHPGTHT